MYYKEHTNNQNYRVLFIKTEWEFFGGILFFP